MATKTDLERAFDTLRAKQEPLTKLWNYYDGDQPLKYSTERLRSAFQNINARFNQNWCAVVVDSVSDRLSFKGFEITDNQAAADMLNAVFNSQRISTDIYDAHEAALVCGESYVITWVDENGMVEAFYNDPRMVHLFYEMDNPKVKEYAAKWWHDDDGRWKMNLYYLDRIEHYETRVMQDAPTESKSFSPSDPDHESNEFGIIPVFHLRISRRKVKSELTNVITLQDAVNKLLADMMVAAEFGAFKQRWIISNSDTKDLKNAPGNIWSLPASDSDGQGTQVGEFNETNLDMYLNSIDKLVNSIAIITRTPKHYFMSTGANVSGDALIALESPLVRKVKRYADIFDDTWVEMARFLLDLLGQDQIMPDQIKPVWGVVVSIQPQAEAATRESAIRAGLPLVTQLRREGWTQKDIEQMQEDKLAEQATAQATLAKALLSAEREFNRGEAEAARRALAEAETLAESEGNR